MRDARSSALFAKAQRVIPGGVNSPARAFRAVGREPVFIARGEGCRMWDADGNEYVDFVGSWGPLLLGHRHPEVVAAVRDALERGTSFGAPTEAEVELAELITEVVPSMETVRLVNSGTEATMSALRVARGYTGRDLAVKFVGNYHGHVDSLLVKAGSGLATLGISDSAGVPGGVASTTLPLPYNDIPAVDEAFDRHGGRIAAVILEPVVGNMGCVPPEEGFLARLREVCSQHGAVLIFDEVMTGFRVALGGAQSLFGVRPDMTTLGKVIGGGLPVGAFGGRREIMDCVAPLGPVYQAGTLSGNPLAVAGGLATLKHLRSHPRGVREDRIGWCSPSGRGDGGRQQRRNHDHEQPRRIHADLLLHGSEGAELGGRRDLQYGGIRALLSRDAGSRHLPAVLAVRGSLRVLLPWRWGHRAHGRGRRQGFPCGCVTYRHARMVFGSTDSRLQRASSIHSRHYTLCRCAVTWAHQVAMCDRRSFGSPRVQRSCRRPDCGVRGRISAEGPFAAPFLTDKLGCYLSLKACPQAFIRGSPEDSSAREFTI